MVKAFLAAAALVIAAAPASAHPAPFSYLDIVFRGGVIEGTLVVHVIDVAHDLGIEPVERLLDDVRVQAGRERIALLLQPRILLRANRRLSLDWQSVELLKEEQAIRLKYRIVDEQPGALAIDTNLFPYDPVHQTFVNVYEEGELRQQLIFNAASEE